MAGGLADKPLFWSEMLVRVGQLLARQPLCKNIPSAACSDRCFRVNDVIYIYKLPLMSPAAPINRLRYSLYCKLHVHLFTFTSLISLLHQPQLYYGRVGVVNGHELHFHCLLLLSGRHAVLNLKYMKDIITIRDPNTNVKLRNSPCTEPASSSHL